MVTTTSTHPLHTNPTTAALWITRETVAILTNIAMLATILAVGNLFLYQPPSLDFLTPTPGQMIIAAVLAAITIAGGIAGRRLNSSIRFRTPGAINNDPDAKYAPPTLIAITISVLCTWMALAAIITLTPAENRETPGHVPLRRNRHHRHRARCHDHHGYQATNQRPGNSPYSSASSRPSLVSA